MKRIMKNIGGLFVHPIETFDEMKFVRYQSWPFVLGLMVVWFAVAVLERQYVGFRFNYNDPDKLNIFIILSRTILPYILFCVCNWAVSTLMDGEGKFGEIFTYIGYVIVPHILMMVVNMALSNILTAEEGFILTWVSQAFTIFFVCIGYQAVRVVHQYGFSKTVWTILLTIFVMLVVVILGFLLYSLFSQVFVFIGTVYKEIRFRI